MQVLAIQFHCGPFLCSARYQTHCFAFPDADIVRPWNAAANQQARAGGTYVRVIRRTYRYRQIEMIPAIAPVIADALAKARMVTISGDAGGGGAADSVTNNITSVIQTVLAAQLVSTSGVLQPPQSDREVARENGKEGPATAGVLPDSLQNPAARGVRR